MVNFPMRIPDCDSHNPALWISFFLMTLGFVPPLGNSDHVVFSVSIDFPSKSKWDATFPRIAYDYSQAGWNSLHNHLTDVPWSDIFKLSTSAAASEFCEQVQVEIDVYITHCKYQIEPHLSSWISAACAAAIVHRNHQKDKSSESQVKFKHASNHCKRVLEAAKLAYANKTKESITWLSGLANSVLNKGKSAIHPLFNGLEMFSSASDKAQLFAENFSKNTNLDDSGISLPVFPFRIHLKLHNISVTLKMVENVIMMNLDLPKASGPDCIPAVILKNCEPEHLHTS